jgi:predicted transposase/invertase (TIGR01784 family)
MSKKQETGTGQAKKKKSSDYDSAWKDVIEILFEAFLEFFFPHIHRDVDFSKGIEILSSELRKITPAGKVGKRFADVLVKVYLKDGSQKCFCVFIHVEVQGTKETDFMLRMFIYYYRTFDKYRKEGTEVISLAILTDEDENWRPDEHVSGRWGFDLRMKIPVVKLIDYKNNKELREKAESSINPMAMVVKAQLKNYELKRADDKKKSTVKWELIRQCYEKGYTRRQIKALLKFIDWIIQLPEGLNKQLSEKITKLEEDYKMPYVTSWERIAEERGVKIGEEKGKVETARKLIQRGIDIEIIAEATGFSKEEIEKFAATDH